MAAPTSKEEAGGAVADFSTAPVFCEGTRWRFGVLGMLSERLCDLAVYRTASRVRLPQSQPNTRRGVEKLRLLRQGLSQGECPMTQVNY
jgi:hypothetical protein